MLAFLVLFSFFSLKPFTLMLDPAGDGRDAGRVIGDSFESGIAFQYAEACKRSLEEAYPAAHVLISRYPGEILEPYHQANFANRAQVDFFIRIQFYADQGVKSHCYCFYYCANPVTDAWPLKLDPYALIPFHEAHRLVFAKTKLLGKTFVDSLAEYLPFYDMHDLIGMPCAPLRGLQVPAVCLEFGIKEPNDWQKLVKPLVESLEFIIRS